MARTGRPPTPIEIKRKRGTDRPDRTPARGETVALRPADGIPPVPIALQSAGRAYWERVWTAAGAWLSPDLDTVAVEQTCQLVDEVRDMREKISQDGATFLKPITTPSGQVVGAERCTHPLIKELRAAEKQLQSWLSTLGFDPTARSRLGLAEVKRQSALQQLLQNDRPKDGDDAIDGDAIEILSDG